MDQVLEVAAFDRSQIEPPPTLCRDRLHDDLIAGVGRGEKHMVLLLELQPLLDGGGLDRFAREAA